MSTLTIAVVSPSDVTRAGLAALAAGLPDLTVGLELSSITQLAPPPDGPPVAIVDITRLRAGSLNERYWSMLPAGTRTVLVCRPGDPPPLPDAIRAGARALILADATGPDLRLAVEAAALDSIYVSPGLAGDVFGGPPAHAVRLANREIETLRLVADGLTNAMISERLGVTEATTETYIKRVRLKLNAANKADLTARAIKLGYLSPSAAP
ncbi:response regulator transcription factor [Winogradskya consettensis]|uniref:DNA-binding response regulator n=1 Tax=Winogradskya consettensis TaxID=113560 RepID=A0A919VSQ6_9ACTN|nr:response regulator transcription factor [Actinoplanes consettensis]GIM68084.1 DNA-binding response regulator [Actinoplanes consettensis]